MASHCSLLEEQRPGPVLGFPGSAEVLKLPSSAPAPVLPPGCGPPSCPLGVDPSTGPGLAATPSSLPISSGSRDALHKRQRPSEGPAESSYGPGSRSALAALFCKGPNWTRHTRPWVAQHEGPQPSSGHICSSPDPQLTAVSVRLLASRRFLCHPWLCQETDQPSHARTPDRDRKGLLTSTRPADTY